uniref:RING-type E3 ubiquitin transferase n=1 Tax=Salix viminalis TaxID=40686 RepID=A0A6N2MRV3_SALVM
MRHPNLITLVGACPEAWTLIYEYLPNGRTTLRLYLGKLEYASNHELCSVLIFLHSSKPHSMVHGDLKPANILLDEDLVTKLSDFGICRLLDHKEGSSNNTTICRTDPKGTFTYMDPECSFHWKALPIVRCLFIWNYIVKIVDCKTGLCVCVVSVWRQTEMPALQVNYTAAAKAAEARP